MFSEGDRLMKAGKLDAACDAFDASNRIEPRAGTLIRLGECREQNQQLASAWSAYKDALTRVKDPRKRAFATRKVAALEPRLSYLTVAVSDDRRVDGLAIMRNGQPLDPALWNHAVPVNGGDYVLAGRAPGHTDWKATITVPVESGKIVVEVPRLDELAPQPAAKSAATSRTPATNPPAANPSATRTAPATTNPSATRTTTAPATTKPSATRPATTAGAAASSSGNSASTASSAPASSRTATAGLAPAPSKATASPASARSGTTADRSAPAPTTRSTSAASASSRPASEAPAAAAASRRPAAPRARLTDEPGAPRDGDSAGGPASPWTGRRKLAVGIGVAGAASLVVGGVLGTMATGKRDEAHELCTTTAQPCSAADRANQLVQDGKGLALGANIAFGVAGLLVVGAVAQWFTGAPEAPHRVSVVPTAAPGEAGLTVVGRF